MDQSDRYAPRQQKQAQTAAPRLKLVEWHGITVARYESGECRAWHNRMDMPTRRTYSVALHARPLDASVMPWYLNALECAVRDLRLDVADDERLW